MINKRKLGQIWVETVIYTLIGLAVIGLLLAIARPKIAQTQDDFVIKQTISAMNELDKKVSEVKQAVGNRRIVEFQLSRGTLTIDSTTETISWVLTGSNFMFSEPGTQASIGRINALTKKVSDKYDVTLTMDYNGIISMTTNNIDNKLVTLQTAKTPYNILIENVGEDNGKVKIDISIS
ncbi:hypothetical protein HZA33_03395 [Candidatus Pacearchaeota archaeon]|nr:hypothetical protein [Candidatus Pacearchaeota archaeon]